MPNQFESLNTVLLIVLVLSVIVALVIFTYACTQVIGPMISRLRSSNIVFAEEAEKSTHEGHI